MPTTDNYKYDVAIIGGGPSGSTLGALLKKYYSKLSVAIFERENFPRDHIGESLLPPISAILHEMGSWDAIERANFPIKIGATYRWGRRPELWDYDFIPVEQFVEEPRPAKFEGLRQITAFQVDRSVYDTILLDHAKNLGCEVFQNTKVSKVLVNDDGVEGLQVEDRTITARHYVDASGSSGILRRAVDVVCEYPSTLQNIAIYDYWQNADWAVEIGVGATRIQIRSLGYGWIWFIPLGPTRTSIGLVIPVEYYKKIGKKPEELYREALASEASFIELLKNAECEENLQTTTDWSFLAERQYGKNWYLIGECAGFADPILSAGVTMAHISAQQLAYTILEIERGHFDPEWLKFEFQRQQQQRIRTHIRFADFWYTANSQLTDLKEFTSQLAKDAGLELDPESAWDWISRGGFIQEDATVEVGGFTLSAMRDSGEFLTELAIDSPLEQNNVLELDLSGSVEKDVAVFVNGEVKSAKCYFRNGKALPVRGLMQILLHVLSDERQLPRILGTLSAISQQYSHHPGIAQMMGAVPESLEGLIRDGWIRASFDPNLPKNKLLTENAGFRWNRDTPR